MAYATYSGGFSITTIQCHQGKLNGSPSLELNLIEKKVVASKKSAGKNSYMCFTDPRKGVSRLVVYKNPPTPL